MTTDNSIQLSKSATACCRMCNPAGLVDYERAGVRVERLGESFELCFVCIEALKLVLSSDRVRGGELTMNPECAGLARAMLARGVRL